MKCGESDEVWNSGVSDYSPSLQPPPLMGYPMQMEAATAAVGQTQPTQNIYINGNLNTVNAQCHPIPPTHVSERRDDEPPRSGLGLGWILFIMGFFLGIPWYAGFFLLLCNNEPREKPGFIACTIAAGILTVAVVLTGTTT